jgi:uncharacterized protein (TIGR02271 family)
MPNMLNLDNRDIDTDYNLEGYDAYGTDEEKLGSVAGVVAEEGSMQPCYLAIDAGGWFSTKQFLVPTGDVREVDEDQRRVYFQQLTKQTLGSDRYPRYDESVWERGSHAEFREYERGVVGAYRPERGADEAVDYRQDLYRRPVEGAQRLRLMEEHLVANKERYQAGSVTLGKRIVEHTETVEVPLREERVIIERHPVDERVEAGEITETDERVRVELMRERAVAEKEAVVTEEVGVRKEAVEHTERVTDTVRKEELVVEEHGDVNVAGDANRARQAEYEREQTRRS